MKKNDTRCASNETYRQRNPPPPVLTLLKVVQRRRMRGYIEIEFKSRRYVGI